MTAPDTAPRVWILGNFSMTDSALPMHGAGLVAALLAAGAQVQTLSFHPGAFAAAHLEQGALGERGVFYPRAALRLTAGQRGPLLWLRRWRALSRAIRNSRRVWVIHGPGLAERTLTLSLQLAARRRLTRLPLSAAPHLIARRICPGAAPPPHDAEAAMQVSFAHISASGGGGVRLTRPLIELALARAPDLPAEARVDLARLAEAAQAVRPQQAEVALAGHRRRSLPQPSRAIEAALSCAPGAAVPRILEHLRQTGAPKSQLRIWAHPPTPPTGDRGLAAVVLRHLAGAEQPWDQGTLRDLGRPALPGAALTRLDWFLTAALRPAAPSLKSLRRPWECADMLAAVARQERPPAPGFSIIGIAANDSGLAQNFWMSARALQMAGLQPRLRPLDAPRATLTALPAPAAPPLQLARSVTLSHMGAERLPQALLDSAAARQGYNIGFLLWELDRLPRAHQLALRMLDEIWVPSMFLHRLFRRRTDRPVVFMRKGIALPTPAPWPGPPPGVRRFAVCFDQRSSVARKNPLAAVRAFTRAFDGRKDVELIVKTTPVPPGHWGDPEGQMPRIRAIAADDPRIRVIEAQLPLPELLGLLASADCLVSPHRAEGFGYLPAFALSLGVPVAVTDYSGTQDFCTPLTAYPVPAELVPVPEGQAILPAPGASWAEVDPETLATVLAHVADNPDEARARARAGQLVMQTDYGMAAQAERYLARLAALGLIDAPAPAETEERA